MTENFLVLSTGEYVYQLGQPMGGDTYMRAGWWQRLGARWKPHMIYTPDSLFSCGRVLRRGTGKEYVPAHIVTEDDERHYIEFCTTHHIERT